MFEDLKKAINELGRTAIALEVTLIKVQEAERSLAERESRLTSDSMLGWLGSIDERRQAVIAAAKEAEKQAEGAQRIIWRLDERDANGLHGLEMFVRRVRWLIESSAASPEWLKKVGADLSSVNKSLDALTPAQVEEASRAP